MTYSPTDSLRSTIGAGGLNCRVRHGTGCDPSAKTTGNPIHNISIDKSSFKKKKEKRGKGLGVLVPVSSTPLRAYTSGLCIP